MTTKDLRIKYKSSVKDAPFKDNLDLTLSPRFDSDIIEYIEFLEEKLLHMQNQLEETYKINFGG